MTPLPHLEEPLYIDDFYQLTCTVLQGDPPFRIQWLFRNKPFVGNENVKTESTKRSSVLSFEAVNADNMGEYICVASNKAGFSNSSTELIVKGASYCIMTFLSDKHDDFDFITHFHFVFYL